MRPARGRRPEARDFAPGPPLVRKAAAAGAVLRRQQRDEENSMIASEDACEMRARGEACP